MNGIEWYESRELDGNIEECSQCHSNIATDEDLCEECWEKIETELAQRFYENGKQVPHGSIFE